MVLILRDCETAQLVVVSQHRVIRRLGRFRERQEDQQQEKNNKPAARAVKETTAF